MKGKELQEKIKNSGVPAKQIYEVAGIPENTFFSLYRKKKVEQHYIDLIASVDEKLYKTLNEEKKENNMVETMAKALSKAVDALSEENSYLRKENHDHVSFIKEYLRENNIKAKRA